MGRNFCVLKGESKPRFIFLQAGKAEAGPGGRAETQQREGPLGDHWGGPWGDHWRGPLGGPCRTDVGTSALSRTRGAGVRAGSGTQVTVETQIQGEVNLRTSVSP